VAEFMQESIVFSSACTMSSYIRKESSRSLSHLLMSFLLSTSRAELLLLV